MRYSKQRELVLRTVEQLCDHPTAEEIYDTAAKECPGLSLGTVYRNLNSLVTGSAYAAPQGRGRHGNSGRAPTPRGASAGWNVS